MRLSINHTCCVDVTRAGMHKLRISSVYVSSAFGNQAPSAHTKIQKIFGCEDTGWRDRTYHCERMSASTHKIPPPFRFFRGHSTIGFVVRLSQRVLASFEESRRDRREQCPERTVSNKRKQPFHFVYAPQTFWHRGHSAFSLSPTHSHLFIGTSITPLLMLPYCRLGSCKK